MVDIFYYYPSHWDKYTDLINIEENGQLLILNYNQECQYSRAWDEVTRMTRGLIVNKETRKIVSFPFKKFFSLNEQPETFITNLPKCSFETTLKIDGACGISYIDPSDNKIKIATRGSFKSEEAIWGTNYLHDMFSSGKVDPTKLNTTRYTYIFEICATGTSFNHVAAGEPGLYLIGMRDLYSFDELKPSVVRRYADELGFKYPPPFDKSIDQLLEEAKTIEATECEGWVLHYENGLKVKVKGLAYIRLARFLQSFSPAHVFEMVMNGETMPDDLPADLYVECQVLTAKFKHEFTRRLNEVEEKYKVFASIQDKKHFALAVISSNPPPWLKFALFARRDNKLKPTMLWDGMYKEEVWKTL